MKWNLCDNRINSLKRSQDYNQISSSEEIVVNPDLCSTHSSSSLMDEPGMKELQELYYDKYDYSTGKFIGMTENTAKQYKNDLKIFYIAFTGKKEMPSEITKFSDIKVRSYQNEKGCQGSNAPFKKAFVGSVKGKDKKGNSSLFYQYAMNLKEMILNTNENQNELLSILFQIFKFVVDPYSGEKKVRINPNLTEELLNQLTDQTRRLIIELYVKCEEDYVKGIKLFEAIVESKIIETTQKQLNSLEETMENLTNKSYNVDF